MTVRILFFSILRDIAGGDLKRTFDTENMTVSELLKALFVEFPELQSWDDRLLIAVNCDYADRDTSIPDGAEVALMPPVQGG